MGSQVGDQQRRKLMAGGKSRKTGQVSKKLISRLIKEHAEGALKKKKGAKGNNNEMERNEHEGFGFNEKV